MHHDIAEHVVMLYYRDIDAARRFYGSTLGLAKVMENDWVTLFRVTSRSMIGTVKEGGTGAFHRAQDENAVMISLATREIERWHKLLKNTAGVEFVKDLYEGAALPMQAFLLRDPGGYTVEFFQWNESPS